MRIQAGVVLIEDDKVSLFERYRDGKHYFWRIALAMYMGPAEVKNRPVPTPMTRLKAFIYLSGYRSRIYPTAKIYTLSI